jgi:hypothetical protein
MFKQYGVLLSLSLSLIVPCCSVADEQVDAVVPQPAAKDVQVGSRRLSPEEMADLTKKMAPGLNRHLQEERRAALASVTLEKMSAVDALSPRDRYLLFNGVQWERGNLQGSLIQQLTDNASNETVFTVAHLLGNYRMEQGAARLSPFIALENKRDGEKRMVSPYKGRYPVVEALIDIGQPSVQPMLVNLADSDDQMVRTLSVKVLRQVFGDAEIARFVVQRAAEKSVDATAKSRLLTASQLFQP